MQNSANSGLTGDAASAGSAASTASSSAITGTTASTTPTLDELKQQRASSKGSITRIKNMVDSGKVVSSTELECRLGMLDAYYKQVSYYQTQIERYLPNDSTRADLDELYVSTKCLILSLIDGRRGQSFHEQTFSMPHLPSNRLPNLKLPKFDGKYLDYKNFINSFTNLVDNDQFITTTEKFNHLLSCLQGEALSTVKAFQITDDNYPKALQRLKERYDNDTLIFLEGISSLFEEPQCNKPDAVKLRQLVDNMSALYSSIKSLGSYEQICDAIVIHLAMSKVDSDTKLKWIEQSDYTKLPKWSECCTLLDKRCQQLDASFKQNIKSQVIHSLSQQVSTKSKKYTMVTKSSGEKICNFCSKSGHWISTCHLFLTLQVDERTSEVFRRQLCINCLSKQHAAPQCSSKYCCRFCKQRHHSLLHHDTSVQTTPSLTASSSSNINKPSLKAHTPISPTSATSLITHMVTPPSTVILATAMVLIKDSNGFYHLARALLDSCSQVNMISDNLTRAINLKRSRASTAISGIGSTTFNVIHKTQTTIRSRINNFEMSLEFLIAPKITGYHPDDTIEKFDLPKNIELADPEFHVSRGIDLLLGTECFFAVLEQGKLILNATLPTLQQTTFGWLVSGKCAVNTSQQSVNSCYVINDNLKMLNENVEKFWKIEDIQMKRKPAFEHEQCESHFKNSVAVDSTGRIMVNLPFKANTNLLGNSRDIALRRFLSIERKLEREPQLKSDYCNFMREYEQLQHMTLLPNPNWNEPHYVIPHHCVTKSSSETTKLRVVFDASCKTASQQSLNDILMVGPTIQNDLAITLLRFRCHQYGLMADITKMYRQVLINPQDRRFQLILWRPNKLQNISTYMLNTVTYGTASAPFLAIRSLQHAAESYPLPYELGKTVIKNDFYVDDMVTGANDLPTLQKIQTEVTAILNHFKFSLCKWHCSHPNLHFIKSRELKLNDDMTSALGVTWHPDPDVFVFSFKPKDHAVITKRTLLSLTSSLFDPLGLVSPIVIRARILLQHLWKEKYNWDDPVPDNIRLHWEKIAADLQTLSIMKFPRFVGIANAIEVQLHGFGDASLHAYGCCVYLRCSDAVGNVSVKLLMSRARVAPLKTRTLPCLELCAAHLLASVWSQISNSLSFQISKQFFWTDSQITLHWIKSESSTLAVFIGNRVAEIQEFTKKHEWRYVSSKENPADLSSRGCTVSELQASIWLQGPSFLRHTYQNWPPDFEGYNEDDDEFVLGRRKSIFVCCAAEQPYILQQINRFSDYNKCLRVVARILQLATRDISPNITAAGMRIALLRIIGVIQQHRFSTEIQQIKRQRPLTGELKSLSPFIDDTQPICLLRVGGRLIHADIPYEAKFPLLLPKNEPFAKVIVRHIHRTNYHAGPRALVSLVQQQFWIINCKSLATRVVHECLHCTRYQPKLLTQIMGDLPKQRVTISQPFDTTGVDFAGPIPTYLRIRGKGPYKSYIALFVCFSTKAVHLEAVTDLSSDAFIAALKRFIGRRGLPSRIVCDNATNFVGADARLREFRQHFLQSYNINKISTFCVNQGVEFSFIPPRAPHFGGLWEAAVKTAKSHLLRTLPNARLTFEELMTALIEIEAVMNSRPLVAASTNPNDFEPLTPSHLANGFGLKNLPELPNITAEVSNLQRWQRITAIKAHFWNRWHREYLAELQNRTRWQTPSDNPKLNDMVVIQDDNLPPMQWIVGRITNIILGPDKRVRVVDVKTRTTTLRRPITKIALLPVN